MSFHNFSKFEVWRQWPRHWRARSVTDNLLDSNIRLRAVRGQLTQAVTQLSCQALLWVASISDYIVLGYTGIHSSDSTLYTVYSGILRLV